MSKRVRDVSIALAWTLATLLVYALLPFRWLRQARRRPARSVWTGTPIINMAICARAERLLGARAMSIVTHTYHVTSEFDRDLSRLRRMPLLRGLVPFALYVWACIAADRLNFFCDRGILPSGRRLRPNLPELRVYKRLGIDVFFYTYGADVRSRTATQALGEPNCCTDCTLVRVACLCDESDRLSAMRELRPLAKALFSMGDMIEYTPGSRNDLFFWPVDLDADAGKRYRPVYPESNALAPLRLVHAPNHRMFKGTRFLEQAVTELQREGERIELVLVERMPNARALEIYRTADVVFDQCLVGFHGYFAIEAMALGKPVLCFIRRPAEYLLAPDECPILNTHVTTLKEDLRRLARERATLPAVGRAGRAYVEKHFSLPAFAARLQRAYYELGVAP